MASKKHSRASRVVIRLAPGIHLDGDQEPEARLVLVCPGGNVQLNRIAGTILRLCDGSRNRDDVVTEVLRDSKSGTRATEIIEFLDVAIARGWIDETRADA